MTPMDMLINAANVLYVLAYFTRDMVRLRCLTLVASACLIAYFVSRPEVLWTVVAWNAFFFALNLAQLGWLLLGRRQSAAIARPASHDEPQTAFLP